MSSFELSRANAAIEPDRLAKAKEAFLSVPKSLTIRRGKIVGEQQFMERLRRAIAAYQANSTI